jgi:hypothetical protein
MCFWTLGSNRARPSGRPGIRPVPVEDGHGFQHARPGLHGDEHTPRPRILEPRAREGSKTGPDQGAYEWHREGHARDPAHEAADDRQRRARVESHVMGPRCSTAHSNISTSTVQLTMTRTGGCHAGDVETRSMSDLPGRSNRRPTQFTTASHVSPTERLRRGLTAL